ncbi:MAG TPA: MarR family EPS-associated transcriptional regulator [Methylococcus sp.]|nr:MarR family EPS-associated transcriptional regulator [Methylococcus sp.]
MFPRETAQLRILQILAQEPGISQRRLAERLGVSVGKTHYLLKALLEKGLIKVDNFRRSDRKLAYLYLLTPRGIETKLRLTRAYFARKEAEYDALREEIAALRNELTALQTGTPIDGGWIES